MDIRKSSGFFTLFFESIALVNRSISALAAYTVLCFVLLAGAVLAAGFLPPSFELLFKAVSVLVIVFMGILLINVIAVKVEQTGESMAQLSSRAVFPTIYLILFFALCSVVFFCLALLSVFLHAPKMMLLLLPVLYFVAIVPLSMAPIAIALRKQGPIEAIGYSWALVKPHYVKVFFTILLSSSLPSLFLFTVGYALYAGIPLYFASTFDLANLSPVWIAFFVVFALCYVMTFYLSAAFPVVTFLNLDYGYNRCSFDVPAAARLAQTTQDIHQAGSVLPSSLGHPLRNPTTQAQAEVGVKKASVSSDSADFAQQHLDQVYSPENAKVKEYMQQEEDRMPTILFDDDMAQQLEQSRQEWDKSKQKSETPPDDAGSIKMSNR